MTAKEFLKQDGINPSSFDNQMRNWSYTESQLLGFAERYHQAKLKELGIANIVGQKEQLNCPFCGSLNFHQITKTTDKCMDCEKCWAV